MGLAERRKIKEIQENTLPGRVKDIEEICGANVTYEIDWDSMGTAETMVLVDDSSCHRLNMALRGICQDEIGKQTVRESLKTVKLKNVKSVAEKRISFQDGVLEMHCAYDTRPDGIFQPSAIEEVFEVLGVTHKRNAQQLRDVQLPRRVKDIEEICGASVQYEIDWDSFAGDAESLRWVDDISCHRLNMALRGICADDMGKEAVRDTLKQVKLKNVKTPAEKRMTFDGGVLDMHVCYAQRTGGMFSDSEIEKELLKKL